MVDMYLQCPSLPFELKLCMKLLPCWPGVVFGATQRKLIWSEFEVGTYLRGNTLGRYIYQVFINSWVSMYLSKYYKFFECRVILIFTGKNEIIKEFKHVCVSCVVTYFYMYPGNLFQCSCKTFPYLQNRNIEVKWSILCWSN